MSPITHQDETWFDTMAKEVEQSIEYHQELQEGESEATDDEKNKQGEPDMVVRAKIDKGQTITITNDANPVNARDFFVANGMTLFVFALLTGIGFGLIGAGSATAGASTFAGIAGAGIMYLKGSAK